MVQILTLYLEAPLGIHGNIFLTYEFFIRFIKLPNWETGCLVVVEVPRMGRTNLVRSILVLLSPKLDLIV